MAGSRGGIAFVYILLVLSTHPLQAARVHEATQMAGKLGEAVEFAREVQEDMRSDSSEATADSSDLQGEYIGEWWASCDQRKEDFERRADKVKQRLEDAKKDGNVDMLEAARVFYKARVLVKTLSKAEKKGCKWAKDRDVDMSVINEVRQETASTSACYTSMQAKLEAAKDGSEERKQSAAAEAKKIFLSSSCQADQPPEVAERIRKESQRGVTIDVLEEEAEDDDAKFEEVLEDAAQLESKAGEGASLLETLEEQASEGTKTKVILAFLGIIFLFIGLCFVWEIMILVVFFTVGVLIAYCIYSVWGWIRNCRERPSTCKHRSSTGDHRSR